MAIQINIPDLTNFKQSIADLKVLAQTAATEAVAAKATLDEESTLSTTGLLDDVDVVDEVAALNNKIAKAAEARDKVANEAASMVRTLLYDGYGTTRNLVPYITESFRQFALGMVPDPVTVNGDPATGGFAYVAPPFYAVPLGGCVVDSPIPRSTFWWGGVNNAYSTAAWNAYYPTLWSPRQRFIKSGRVKQIITNMYLGLGDGTGVGSNTGSNVVFDLEARIHTDVNTAVLAYYLSPMCSYSSPTIHKGVLQFVWNEPVYNPSSPALPQQLYVKEGQYISFRTMMNTTTNGAVPFRIAMSGCVVGEWEK